MQESSKYGEVGTAGPAVTNFSKQQKLAVHSKKAIMHSFQHVFAEQNFRQAYLLEGIDKRVLPDKLTVAHYVRNHLPCIKQESYYRVDNKKQPLVHSFGQFTTNFNIIVPPKLFSFTWSFLSLSPFSLLITVL
jgi:hypothetical protein